MSLLSEWLTGQNRLAASVRIGSANLSGVMVILPVNRKAKKLGDGAAPASRATGAGRAAGASRGTGNGQRAAGLADSPRQVIGQVAK
jgi:hypothetical protein